MALSNGPSTRDAHVDIRISGSEPQPELEDDLEKLESDLHKMAQKILEYRTTLPDQLKATLVTVLSSQRPILPGTELDSDPGPSDERCNSDSRQVESIRDGSKADGEQKNSEKIILLKDKISANIAAMPLVLKRLRECISRMEKLDSCNGIIHPAFKRRKDS
ncbi:hypothetical protein SLEP1_g10047 [Rubroshorea leprosula]|uniref:Uncharacterized protein n=1 Tax=Rubroshorea leprosula TaxID=152421 RepID=A0AAV5I6V7_9ROSI|nr:hypothetical protein SLEP1_g10047 [Rubroshorea leprosula]